MERGGRPRRSGGDAATTAPGRRRRDAGAALGERVAAEDRRGAAAGTGDARASAGWLRAASRRASGRTSASPSRGEGLDPGVRVEVAHDVLAGLDVGRAGREPVTTGPGCGRAQQQRHWPGTVGGSPCNASKRSRGERRRVFTAAPRGCVWSCVSGRVHREQALNIFIEHSARRRRAARGPGGVRIDPRRQRQGPRRQEASPAAVSIRVGSGCRGTETSCGRACAPVHPECAVSIVVQLAGSDRWSIVPTRRRWGLAAASACRDGGGANVAARHLRGEVGGRRAWQLADPRISTS